MKDCLKINGKQRIIMPKKGGYVRFKNYERKMKSAPIIYPDFESILVPEINVKQNTEQPHTNKYQKYIAGSYDYKIVCVDDKFSKRFKTYLGEDTAYNFINNVIEENEYCNEVQKNILTKNLWLLKMTMKILRPLLNVGFVTMIMLIMMLK